MMLEPLVKGMPEPLRVLALGGYNAVQTFFVLSGFVLAQSYDAVTWNLKSLRAYFVARFARIYPVYFFSLLVVSYFIGLALVRPTRSLEMKISLMVDYIFLLQGWKGNLGVGWNTPAWTLTCEFFFYLFFPLLLPIMRRAGILTLTIVIALAIVIPPTLPHYGVPWDWKPVFYLSDFALGIAASRIFDLTEARMKGYGAWLYIPATIAGLALIIHPQTMDGTYGDLATGLRPLNLLALLGLAWGGGAIAKWLSTPTADNLGKASYALYILHVPILWWYSKWAMQRNMPLPRIAAAVLYTAIVIAASLLTYKWIEVPMNKRIRRAWS